MSNLQNTPPQGPVRMVPAQFQFKKIDKVGGAKNPTYGELMGAEDKSKWRKVRVPKLTLIAGVIFEPIWLGKLKFMPGEEYALPPEIATELETSIRNYENGPGLQMTGNVKIAKAIELERGAQDNFRINNPVLA